MSSGKADVEASAPSGWSSVASGICSSSSVIDRFARLAGGYGGLNTVDGKKASSVNISEFNGKTPSLLNPCMILLYENA